MLELAVAEIQHQDELVWNMKQDEHNKSVSRQAFPRYASFLTPFNYGTGSLRHTQWGDISVRYLMHFSFTCSAPIRAVSSRDIHSVDR